VLMPAPRQRREYWAQGQRRFDQGQTQLRRFPRPLAHMGGPIPLEVDGAISALGQKRTLFTAPFYVRLADISVPGTTGRIYEYTP